MSESGISGSYGNSYMKLSKIYICISLIYNIVLTSVQQQSDSLMCCAQLFSLFLCCNSMDCVAQQAPQSIEFSRQEYWSELPFPPPGDLPDPWIKPVSPASPILAGRFFTIVSPIIYVLFYIVFHYGLSQDIECDSVCYTVGHCCPSIPCVIVCIY